jgi:hypothetical protein
MNKQLEEDELDEDEEMEEGNNLSMCDLSAFLQDLNPNGPDATDIMDRIRYVCMYVCEWMLSLWTE